MKAVVLEAFGDADQFKLKEVKVPEPKKGEVRIKVAAAAFNPVDYKIRQGLYGGETPLILGADCSGVIDEIGPDALGFCVGEEVYAMPFAHVSNGSYAEYLCVPAAFVAKKPKNLNFEQAAAIPLVAMTAYRAMIASQALHKGDTIFIAGAGGGVGSLGVQLARFSEVKAIFTVAGSEESSLYMQKEFGLKKEHILLYRNLTCEQMIERLIAMNQGKMFDATFDFVGKEMKRLCLKIAGHSGHFSTIVPENESFEFPVWGRGESVCFNRNLSLHFVFVGAEGFSGPESSWEIYTRHLSHISHLLENGALKAPAIQVLGSLSEKTVVEAHRLLEEGKVKGKLVMRVSN